jgi:hypothetical protein
VNKKIEDREEGYDNLQIEAMKCRQMNINRE